METTIPEDGKIDMTAKEQKMDAKIGALLMSLKDLDDRINESEERRKVSDEKRKKNMEVLEALFDESWRPWIRKWTT